MLAYSVLAKYYDKFIDKDCDYIGWSQYLYEVAELHGVKEIADLACGTGKMTRLLAAKGYRMTGVDVSAEMLNVARQQCKATFVLQDMKKLRLAHPADMAICVNDGVNYIAPTQLTSFFKRVAANLSEGAPFVFDISGEYKLAHQIGNNVFYIDGDDETLLWNNRFDGKSVTMELTLFVKRGDGAYDRFDETHLQYLYTQEQIKDSLAQANFSLKEISDGYGNKPYKESLRLTFYAIKR